MPINELKNGDSITISKQNVEKYTDNSSEIVERYYLKTRCCDCGLVHRIFITPDKGKGLNLQFFRDERSTAQTRRRQRERS